MLNAFPLWDDRTASSTPVTPSTLHLVSVITFISESNVISAFMRPSKLGIFIGLMTCL
jgi:hypothetical protein